MIGNNFNFLDPTRPTMGGPLMPQGPGAAPPGASPATGSVPMNLMPQNASMQPGQPNIQGFLQQLMGLAQGGADQAQAGLSPAMDALQGMFNPNYLPKSPSLVASWMMRGKGPGGLY